MTSIDFDFCNLSSSGDVYVVYKERWPSDIDASWLLIYFTILWAFYVF
jgi:hypothetical protein